MVRAPWLGVAHQPQLLDDAVRLGQVAAELVADGAQGVEFLPRAGQLGAGEVALP
jgi:hypothetical protein